MRNRFSIVLTAASGLNAAFAAETMRDAVVAAEHTFRVMVEVEQAVTVDVRGASPAQEALLRHYLEDVCREVAMSETIDSEIVSFKGS